MVLLPLRSFLFLFLLTDTVVARKPTSAKKRDRSFTAGRNQGLEFVGDHLPAPTVFGRQNCQLGFGRWLLGCLF